MKRYISAICVCAAGLIVGCNAPAPDTRDADVKAVKDLEAAWAKDAASKDVEKFVSYYAEDAAVLAPNAPIAMGKTAARDMLKPLMADPNFALMFQATRAEASKGGDLVYTVGTYTMTLSDKDKKPMTDKGKYATIFKKQADGSWKVVVDAFNSDMPMTGTAPQ